MSRLYPGAFTEVEQLQDELAAFDCALRHRWRAAWSERRAQLQARLMFLRFWGHV